MEVDMNSMKLIALTTLALFLTPAVALAAQPTWMDTKTKELVDAARAETNQVPIADLKRVIDEDEDVIIIDVRTPDEFEVAHVPDAYNIPRGLLEFSIWSVAPDLDETIYVYCRSGARAALAAKQMQELGYTNVYSVSTGSVDWAQSGYPLQTSILDERVIILPVQD
jgi:rhodanese-related sulfurtransferase